MHPIVRLLCLTLAIATPLPQLPAVAEAHPSTDALHEMLGGYAAAERLGFVALVARGDEVHFHRAYGEANRKQELANRPDTAFDIGSISKTFTAAAIYQLVDEGKLELDDALPEHFTDVPDDKREVTIEQVLNHSSGLAQYHDRKGDFEKMTRAKALGRILGGELQHAPGSVYAYSNAGYALLAILVEKLSGQPFRSYCREHLFEPLGMEQTGFYGETERWNAEDVATGYGDSREGKNSPWHWQHDPDQLWATLGAGGIVSTAEDLLRWARARTKLFPEPRPPADLGQRRRASQGWFLARRDTTGLQVFHGGAVDMGFIAMLRSYPEHDITLVLLSNTFVGEKPNIRSHMTAIEELLFSTP